MGHRVRTALGTGDSTVLTFLALLLTADLLFALMSLAHDMSPRFKDEGFSLETDRGFAEVFQYVKFLWAGLLAGALAVRTRHLPYLAWALLFGYFLVDDSMRVHERGGEWLAQRFVLAPRFGLAPMDVGQLGVFAAVAVIAGGIVALAWRYGRAEFRRETRTLLVLLVILAACGIGLDAVHALVDPGPASPAVALLGTLEDGGEMIAVSLICCHIFRLATRTEPVPSPSISSRSGFE